MSDSAETITVSLRFVAATVEWAIRALDNPRTFMDRRYERDLLLAVGPIVSARLRQEIEDRLRRDGVCEL